VLVLPPGSLPFGVRVLAAAAAAAADPVDPHSFYHFGCPPAFASVIEIKLFPN